jgi:AraC-like DNA-binding protein
MANPLDTSGIVMLLGAIHGLFLAVALFAIRRSNRASNRILAVLLFLFSATILLHTLAHAKYSFEAPYFKAIQPLFLRLLEPLAFFYIVAFTFGPLVYLYVLALTEEKFSLTSRTSFHFFPSIGCLAMYSLSYTPTSMEQPDHFATEQGGFGAIVPWLIIVHMALYIFAAFNLVREHQRSRKEAPLPLKRTKLRWLRLLIVSFLITWIVALLTEVYSSRAEAWNYLWILVSLQIYTVGYMGLIQPEIFTGVNRQSVDSRGPDDLKYEKSTLTEAKAEEYLRRLKHAMTEKKLYVRNDLSLNSVAKELSISHHHLSQVINQQMNKNFYEFVNSHRINEAKKRLTDSTYAHLGISEIAYEVGFNSSASFNSAFKRFTQMTPSQFRSNAAP